MTAAAEAAPRVLIVMAQQWLRAQLRAALRESGYDALGAQDIPEALTYPAEERGRGPVRLIVLDQSVLQGVPDSAVTQLLRRHGGPATLLLASALTPLPSGPWDLIVRRPASIADILGAVQRQLALPTPAAHPID